MNAVSKKNLTTYHDENYSTTTKNGVVGRQNFTLNRFPKKSPLKSSLNSPLKSSINLPLKSPLKSSINLPLKSPLKSPKNSFYKSPYKSPKSSPKSSPKKIKPPITKISNNLRNLKINSTLESYKFKVSTIGKTTGEHDEILQHELGNSNTIFSDRVHHTLKVNLLYGNAFLEVAKRYNVIIGVRAPNILGETLLKEGYPSKNFHMKAKSSPTGPTAGFITEDACYSKVLPYSYKNHDESIASAKNKGAKAVDLIISESRIAELCKTGNLNFLGHNQYSANYPGGTQTFMITDNGRVLKPDGQPVKVMTNPPEIGEKTYNSRPITADYDLFTIIPYINQNYNLRPLSIPPKLLHGKFDFDFLKPNIFDKQSQDANMGNIHYFGKVIINALNQEINKEGYKGGKLVWHGDEMGNPASPGFVLNDKPIFFLPSGKSLQIQSLDQLKKFFLRLKNQGYPPEYNAIFGF